MDAVRLIKTESDYDEAMQEIEAFFENLPEPGTPEGNRFELLSVLVARYEDERFPIASSDPVDLLWSAIRDMGRLQKDLAALLGSRSRASEVLNRRRALNLEQIRKISAAWKIPIIALTPAYELRRESA